jgi:PTS system nitrogen regulatory IIA component
MRLELREVARLLRISERTIDRWVRRGDLPAMRIKNQWFVNKLDLLEWASKRGVELGPDMARAWIAADEVSICDAIRRGGIHFNVPGHTREAVLHAVVKRLSIVDDADREFIFQGLLAREALGSTAIGSAIAIPHVRNPIVVAADAPSVTVCLLENPIDFDAPDHLPVRILFTIVSPTPRVHLQILSRLMFLLQDEGLRALLVSVPAASELLDRISTLEQKLSPSPATPATGD